MPKSPIVVDLVAPQRLPPASIPEAVERALLPIRNSPVPIRYVGEGFGAQAVPRETWWRQLACLVAHEVKWWGVATGRRVDIRQLDKDDIPSDGIAIESTNGHALDDFLLYVLAWDADTRSLVLHPVSHAAKQAAGL